MQVEFQKEHPDGSATYTFDMTPEETRMMLLFGIRRAMEEACKAGSEWDETEDYLQGDLLEKPVVEYREFGSLQQWPGEPLQFYANIEGVLNHPELGYQRTVRTSLLVTLPDEAGTFETLNTKYVRVKDE